MSSLLSLLLLPALASAHFNLNAPPVAGEFDEDTEANAPCGGVTVDISTATITDFHVGGQEVAMLLGHTQANWLFRATLDQTGSGNYTQLFPIVMQTGLGNFCEPSITAPESWVGQKGVLSVVANAPDGLLYQCAAVNFVSGTGTTTSDCKNGTVTASFVDDTTLTALVGTSSSNSSSSSTATSTGSSTTASSSASAAAGQVTPSARGLVGSIMAVAAIGMLGMDVMM